MVERTIATHNVTAVAHFAAKIVVPASITYPLEYYLSNIKSGVLHLIFSSTAALYGSPAISPVSEDFAPAPINPYGRSKLMSEWMLADIGQAHPLRYIVLRCFNIAGAAPRERWVIDLKPHAPHQGRLPGSARSEAASRHIRHGLSHHRWNLRARLRPHD